MRYIFYALCFLLTLGLYSQRITTAKVVDSSTDEPVSGISISLNNGDTTTTTNGAGYFQLFAEEGDTLIVSGKGYE